MRHAVPFVTCQGCGKRGYETRKLARAAMKAQALQGVGTYQCKASPTGLWHLGHLPDNVKAGRFARGALGPAAPRTPRPQ